MESSSKSWLLCSILLILAITLGTYFGLRREGLGDCPAPFGLGRLCNKEVKKNREDPNNFVNFANRFLVPAKKTKKKNYLSISLLLASLRFYSNDLIFFLNLRFALAAPP